MVEIIAQNSFRKEIKRLKKKYRTIAQDFAKLLGELEKNSKNPRPTVLMIPHFAMMETITMFPLLVDIPIPQTGVFYRPFDNKDLEDWIKESRERFGVELVSRKGGVLGAIDFLNSPQP